MFGVVESNVRAGQEQSAVPLVGLSMEGMVAVDVGRATGGEEPLLGRSGGSHLQLQVAKVSGKT